MSQRLPLTHFQPGVPALHLDVLERDAGDALGGNADLLPGLGLTLGGTDHPCPSTVQGDVGGFDDDATVGFGRIEYGVLGDFQRGGGSSAAGEEERHACHRKAAVRHGTHIRTT